MTAIENVPTTGTSKDAAKQEITNAAEAKKSAIDGQAGLTSEEKAAAKKAVDAEAEKAKSAIDKATDQAGVDKAKNDGLTAIENVPTNGTNVTTAKEAAKKEITDAANKKKAAIDANPALTKEEKEAAKKAVDAEAEKAKQEIDKATDQAGIDKAKNDGLTAIENVPTNGTNVTTAKEAAKKAVDETNSRKVATELPNTGTTDSTVAVLAAVASAMLGLSFAGLRRKEDEEDEEA